MPVADAFEAPAFCRRLVVACPFAAAGQGFGFTYHRRLGFTRLDHVWGGRVKFNHAEVLPDALSDHRALLVRLELP